MLLGVTGSVAAIKVPELATKLLRFADVRIVATPSARHFFTQEQLPAECAPLLGESLSPLQSTTVLYYDHRACLSIQTVQPNSAACSLLHGCYNAGFCVKEHIGCCT